MFVYKVATSGHRSPYLWHTNDVLVTNDRAPSCGLSPITCLWESPPEPEYVRLPCRTTIVELITDGDGVIRVVLLPFVVGFNSEVTHDFMLLRYKESGGWEGSWRIYEFLRSGDRLCCLLELGDRDCFLYCVIDRDVKLSDLRLCFSGESNFACS